MLNIFAGDIESIYFWFGGTAMPRNIAISEDSSAQVWCVPPTRVETYFRRGAEALHSSS